MAILKCKMCGGDLNITADEKIVECEFCGTTQTIPGGSAENPVRQRKGYRPGPLKRPPWPF